MTSKAITFTLDVYTADGTAVDFSVSSIVGGALPYLSGEPTGDGQEFDPLTGETRAGAYTGTIVDAITSGTTRVITGRLEDAGFRQQLMRRKSILTTTVDGVAEVLCAGLLTRLAIVSGAEAAYDYTVTDRTSLQGDQQMFAPKSAALTLTGNASIGATSLSCAALTLGLPKNTTLNFGAGKTAVVSTAASAGATSFSVSAIPVAVVIGDIATYQESITDFLVRWPHRGCAFGGPVIGGFLNQPDDGGWVMTVAQVGVFEPFLQFVKGYGPPNFLAWSSDITTLAGPTNQRVGNYTPRGATGPDGASNIITVPITTFDQASRSPFANDLIVDVMHADGTLYGRYQPNIFGVVQGDDASLALVETGHHYSGQPAIPPGVWLTGMTGGQFAASGLPAFGTQVRARAFTATVSDISPIYYTAHPVDWVVKYLDEMGFPYDATSVTTVRNLVGADRLYSRRIAATEPAAQSLRDNILGPFGIGLRMKDDGTLELFSSRIFSNTPPSTTITADDVILPQEGGAGPVFEIDESSSVAKLVLDTKSLVRTTGAQPSFEPDGIHETDYHIERINADPGVVGTRTQSYTMGGMVHRLGGAYAPDPAFADAFGRELFDRYGRGIVQGELPLLRGGSGDGAKIGDELIVGVPQLPNHNKRLGDDGTVSGRAMQIVRLTKRSIGALAKFSDSGPNAQPFATVPTISIAASSDDARHIAVLTITNAATLNAAGAGCVVVMSATTGSTPAVGDYVIGAVFPAGQIPTGAFALPSVSAGRKVFAKVAATKSGNRPSSYSAASSVTLTAYTAPSSLTATPVASDGSSCALAWVIGEATLPTDVFVRLQADGASANIAVVTLLPGSNRYTLEGLTAGTNYTASVQQRDPVTGDTTALVTVNFTSSASAVQLAAPTSALGFSEPNGGIGNRTRTGLYGMAVMASEIPGLVEFSEALEDGAGANTYSAFAVVSTVASVSGDFTIFQRVAPNDGRRRKLRARHIQDGATSSPYTSSVTVTPWTMDPLVVEEESISLNDFKSTDSADGTTRTFTMVAGSRVSVVMAFLSTQPIGTTTDPWPPNDATALAAWVSARTGTVTPLVPDATTRLVSFTVTLPDIVHQSFVQFEPRLADLTPGPVRRVPVFALPIPSIAQGTAAVDTNGATSWQVDGPDVMTGGFYAESLSDWPSDATTLAGTAFSGRQFSRVGGPTLSFGATLYITVIGTTAAGTTTPSIRLKIARQSFTATKTTTYAATMWTIDPSIGGSKISSPIVQPDYTYSAGIIVSADLSYAGSGPVTRFTSFVAHPVIADGVTVTEVLMDMYDGSVDLTNGFSFSRMNGTTQTSLGGGATVAGGGWQTPHAILSESTSGRTYEMGVTFLNQTTNFEAAGQLKFGSTYITTTVPDPSKNV